MIRVGRSLGGCAPAVCAQQAGPHSAVCLLQQTVRLSMHKQPILACYCKGCLADTAGVCLLNPVRVVSKGQCYGSQASIIPTLHAVAVLKGYQLSSHRDDGCWLPAAVKGKGREAVLVDFGLHTLIRLTPEELRAQLSSR